MLKLGISLESILSREPPNYPAGRPRKAKKVKDKAKKNQGKQAQENGAPEQKQKPRSRPGSPHSGMQRGGSNAAHQNGQGGRRGVPSRIRPNNS